MDGRPWSVLRFLLLVSTPTPQLLQPGPSVLYSVAVSREVPDCAIISALLVVLGVWPSIKIAPAGTERSVTPEIDGDDTTKGFITLLRTAPHHDRSCGVGADDPDMSTFADSHAVTMVTPKSHSKGAGARHHSHEINVRPLGSSCVSPLLLPKINI